MKYRFGRFVIDGDTRQLLGNGDEIHLSPKAFELLTILVENRPKVVSKPELLNKLWPSTFVEETNLAGLVAEIRRALDDSATTPLFVRTVHRFGYRFVGEAEQSEPSSRATTAGPQLFLEFENRRFVLMEGPNIIGRAPDAAIQCEVTGVSRHHARIQVANGEAAVEDLGSKNGTFVENARVTAVRLSDGDEIRLGKARFVFRVGAPMGATETVSTDYDGR